MATEVQSKYHWNPERYQWERIDRIQYYRGFEIQTIRTHDDSHKYYHRAYRVVFPDGHSADFTINKRPGGNIKDLIRWLDYKADRGEFI